MLRSPRFYADVAQLVEHNLAKVGVAGSNPVVRSTEGAAHPSRTYLNNVPTVATSPTLLPEIVVLASERVPPLP